MAGEKEQGAAVPVKTTFFSWRKDSPPVCTVDNYQDPNVPDYFQYYEDPSLTLPPRVAISRMYKERLVFLPPKDYFPTPEEDIPYFDHTTGRMSSKVKLVVEIPKDPKEHPVLVDVVPLGEEL